MAAKRFRAEYSTGDVLGLYQMRKNDGDEAKLRSISAIMRGLIAMANKVEIPSTYQAITKEVRTPFVRDSAHRITASLVNKSPVVHIQPKDDDRQDYREAANLGERFDIALIERLNKETGSDLAWDSTFGHVRDGESVVKVVHRPDAWARFPERDDGEDADEYRKRAERYKRGVDLPIAWTVVDRQSMVYEGGEYGDEWVIEYGEYSKAYCKARHSIGVDEQVTPDSTLEGRPMPEGLQTSNNGVRVKVEFFTAREWHVIIDGKPAPGFPKRNPYRPYLPYFRAPAFELESLLYSLMFLAPRLDELLTMKLNWSYLGAYPNPVIETVPNTSALPMLDGPFGSPGGEGVTEGAPSNTLTWTPGKAMVLPTGKTIRFLEPPAVGQDLNELITIMKSLIDIAGIPSIMRGVSGGSDSGYHASQMRAAAEMAYKRSMLSLQRQFEKALEFTHWLVSSVIRQTVYVMGWEEINPKTGKPKRNTQKAWLGLSPDHQTKNVADVSKLGPVTVQYRPTLMTDEQAQAMIAGQLVNAPIPLSSQRHAMEKYLQEEDAESILDEIIVEGAMREEPLKSMLIENALREAGLLPAQPQVQPDVSGLVNPQGMPISTGMQGGAVAAANQAPPGVPGIPGLTMPVTPPTPQPQGVPGMPGGRPAGAYPGQPGGPRNA
jgi:hypothetical protein